MEASTWASYAVSCLVTMAIVILFSNHFFRRKPNLPPGPKPWPIIGNLNLIGPLLHHSIHELAKTYGPIMMLRFGSVPVLVGSSVDMARLFLTTYDVAFACRPKMAAGKYTTYDYSDVTWASYGPYWRLGRKLCSMELLSPKQLKSKEHIRIEEVKTMIRGIFEQRAKPILMKDHLLNCGLNVISRMVLGERFSDNGEGSMIVGREEFKKMLDEFILLNGVFNIGDWIPSLKFFDLQGYEKRMKIVAKKFDRFLEHVLGEHESRRKSEKGDWVSKDMVDVLLKVVDDPKFEVNFDRKGVKAFCQDFLAGGSETPSVVIEWAMSELLRKPEIITKAIEELDRVMGRQRWILEKDVQELPYIRAIVKETMRLHPAAPMLVPRMSRENVQIEGYDVPKGSIVFVNTFTSQRDPKVYERPNEFDPERFIGRNIDVKGQDFELLPFGSGRRMCPGYNLGLKIVELSLANLLHKFEWKLIDDMQPEDLDMEEGLGISNPKKIRLVVCAKPRLPPNLYEI